MNKIISPFSEFVVTKAWSDNGTLYREGWISTNDRDREKDITEPEAFVPVLDGYFALGAPLSSTHDTKSYPIGHLQKAALVRGGKIFQEAAHPTDSADFEAFPGAGTGMYARLAINDSNASEQVEKGNVGGCSFIASVAKSADLPGGGRRYLEFSNLVETTIAAYPINTKAVLQIAKAYGIQEEEEMTPEQIKEMIAKAVADATAPKEEVAQKAEPTLTVQSLEEILAAHTDNVMKAIDTKIQYSREGVGRAQVEKAEDPREANPVDYIVKKANSGEELDATDKALISELTLAAILEGMRA